MEERIMRTNNPFIVTFGKMPANYIQRPEESIEIISNFEQQTPSIQNYLITGVRGSGKTAMLAYICDHFEKQDSWIVLDMNPERDLLSGIASKLYEKGKAKHLFLKMNFTFSLYGISLSVAGGNPISDPETILEKLLSEVKRGNKKVLIAIDEASNSEHIRVFAHTFQAMLRQDIPIYLLMTGLYENIRSLQNQKTLTFLYRTPTVDLKPLDLISVAQSYEDIFSIEGGKAVKLAKLTCGYAFAYQTLGYLLYEKGSTDIDEALLSQYDDSLRRYVYEKILEDVAPSEKKILFAIPRDGIKTKDLLEKAKVNRQDYSTYRNRLSQKGIINTSVYGEVSFALPRFYEFLEAKAKFDEIL